MKYFLSTLLLVLGLTSFGFAEGKGGYKVGDEAMDFNLLNVNGKFISLGIYKEAKGFIVVFTCNHCPYAKAYQERIKELSKMYAPQGYMVVAINSNDVEANASDSYDSMKVRAKDASSRFRRRLSVTGKVQNVGSDEFFFIKDKGQMFRVNLNDINYIEALGDYINVHTDSRRYTTLMTMKKLEQSLPADKFSRVHRSFIIAVDKIKSINSNDMDVYIREKRIPIGDTYKQGLLKKIKVL